MKILLSALAILLFVVASAKDANETNPLYLTKDSLTYNFNEHWRFVQEDSPEFADKAFDDSEWKIQEPDMELPESRKATDHWFSGIAWFRLHLFIDSSLVNVPLALTLSHRGASEIYLNGVLIKTYGEIKDRNSSVYYDPQNVPFVFSFADTGKQVLAVRYANFDASKNYRRFWSSFAGFRMFLMQPDSAINATHERTTIFSFITILLFAIFLTLGILHLFLFFYSRFIISNLYFSFFAISVAGLCMIGYLNQIMHNPGIQLKALYMIVPLICSLSISFSGFINQIFTKKKRIIFYLIISLSIVTIILRLFGIGWAIYSVTALLLVVAVEAIIAIMYGILRKVKGAKILGAGLLFCILFILTISVLAMVKTKIVISSDDSVSGLLALIGIGLACVSIPISISVYLAWYFGDIHKNLTHQLSQVKVLSQKTLEQEQEKQRLLEIRKEELEIKVNERTKELQVEKKKSDDLLMNILPAEVAEELKQKGSADARQFEFVTVMFADFVDFTQISEKLSPHDLVKELDYCFTAFDNISGKYNLEKIKTIGDAYLAVCGLPEDNPAHAVQCTLAALTIRDFIIEYRKQQGIFNIRIGLHSGPVVAGIVGLKKFAYDIWGDTVNLAARMEQNCEPGQVNISSATYHLIKDHFKCRYRGKIHAKNKGEVEMYFVEEPVLNKNEAGQPVTVTRPPDGD
ncbi:MAG: adenylate/guanylate cyclase domain-containing protein [Bacteroidia bacterium]